MKVLVTGGLGVNGAWVVQKLQQKGIQPLILDRSDDFSLLPGVGKYQYIKADITDAGELGAILARHKPECVIHMAAYLSPEMNREPHPTFSINCGGTLNMLEASVRAGVRRFVYTSSRAAYGGLPTNITEKEYQPVSETHPAWPAKAYDVSKLAAEGIGRIYSEVHGIEFCALRFAGIYGPGKLARHGKLSFYSRLVEEPVAGKSVAIRQGGDQPDDIIYVEEAADGVVAAALAPKLNYTVYNIASGIGRTPHDFASAVRSAVPGADIVIGPGFNPLELDVSYYAIYNPTRAAEDFGFRATMSLEEGVADYVSRHKQANTR